MNEFIYKNSNFEKEILEFNQKKLIPELTLNYEIKVRDFVNTGNASADIKLTLKRLGVISPILRRVAISSYEAEINITAHSQGGNIICNVYPEFVHIQFKDKGPGLKDIEQAMIPGWSTADEAVREMGFGAGLGLPNIKKNSDYLHIVSAENSPTLVEILIFYTEK